MLVRHPESLVGVADPSRRAPRSRRRPRLRNPESLVGVADPHEGLKSALTRRSRREADDLAQLQVGALAGAPPGVGEVQPILARGYGFPQLATEAVKALGADRRRPLVIHAHHPTR